jgi:hypothetical protein
MHEHRSGRGCNRATTFPIPSAPDEVVALDELFGVALEVAQGLSPRSTVRQWLIDFGQAGLRGVSPDDLELQRWAERLRAEAVE